ncbi:MAG: hypothetical protein WCS80_03680 [Bacilli bacterium]
MIKEVLRLTKLNLMISLGFNESKHSFDPNKKKYFTRNLFNYLIIAVMLVFYSSMFSYSLIQEQRGDMIPVMAIVEASSMIFLLAFMRAGNEIFNVKTYEKLVVYPIRPSSIIQSRFLSMLIESFFYSLLIMIPSMILFCLNSSLSPSFVPILLIFLLTMSLFPLTVASVLGSLLTALFSRLKHKNLFNSIFTMILMLGIIVASFLFSFNMSDDGGITHLGGTFETVKNHYFMATWFYNGFVSSSWLEVLYFSLVSLGFYLVFVFVCQLFFVPISQHLQGTINSKNHIVAKQKKNSQLKALVKKDLKLYFNSRGYLINTFFGYIMLIGSVIAFSVVYRMMDLSSYLKTYEPIAIVGLGLLLSFSCTTNISLSFEGKNFYDTLTLPLSNKKVYASKIIMNMVLAVPFNTVAAIILSSVVRFSLPGYIFLFIYPLIYILLVAVIGLCLNIKFPKFDWIDENEIVKNSASLIVSMVISLVGVAVPLTACLFLPDYYLFFLGGMGLVYLLIAFLLIKRINKIELYQIAHL